MHEFYFWTEIRSLDNIKIEILTIKIYFAKDDLEKIIKEILNINI